jgi:hypothetical protein
VPGCEGHERKEEKKQQRLHRDPSEESPGLHETEKQEREGACEKPPSTANQPAHAPILSWIARIPKLDVLGRSGIDQQEHGMEDRGDRRPSRQVALGLPSEAPDRDRAGVVAVAVGSRLAFGRLTFGSYSPAARCPSPG